MKIALVTTTINVPHVLASYRAAFSDSDIIVIGDRKTPDAEVQSFMADMPFATYLSYDEQEGRGFSCHELIGSNSIQRRNIGFLEALATGAEVIFSFDDDNLLTNVFAEAHLLQAFDKEVCLAVDSKSGWFDPGSYLVPPAPHRGFPYDVPSQPVFRNVVSPKVGVVAGLCLGDPDVSSVTRMALSPDVRAASEILHSGICCYAHTVWNSQFTAVRREFIPAWGMIPFVGRMDDIYAACVAQRVMREYGYCVHFGQPFALQQRNQHDLVVDMRAEIDGFNGVKRLAHVLDNIVLAGKNVIEDCRRIWDTLDHVDFIPAKAVAAMQAYINDCEKVK